ncbi:MAG TPA: 2-oxo-4-hydroxy-4-carboxy-5-ureidoimidazoline decarboxylase [Acidobacteriaceae bacterium]|nr:2-oxo-4-hydroxy-4-carboxy-5-ureidoimidazoline decarboxylase [Acidobacteriaceae bacterium]
MNPVLEAWNVMEKDEAAAAVLPCCGSRRWAERMADARPVAEEDALMRRAGVIWQELDAGDWMEAFATHPRIGERKAPVKATSQSAAWSAAEQSAVAREDAAVLAALAEGNRRYEERFGRTYIVCATGKTAREMLEILESRLRNDDAAELPEAAEQQRQITALRLKRWLRG